MEVTKWLKPGLATPPPDGGLWTEPKVATWMAGALGLEKVAPQRGSELSTYRLWQRRVIA